MIPFVLSVVFLLFAASSSASSLVSDFHVLVSLKQGFQFPSRALDSWNASSPSSVCTWERIGCSGGRVSSIHLTDLNLYGSVSPQVSKLDRLVNLSLAGNNFTGTIQLKNLSDLVSLNISNNLLSGDLNWDYSGFENLQVLDVYNNNFTAPLPVGISRLRKLKHFDLGGNYFSGEIPKSYGDLVELEYLQLALNDLHGKIPGELGNLTKLKEIYLGYENAFEGGIPQEFGKLVNLVVMDLSKCGLDGQIPSTLGNLKMLVSLFLHQNQLSGPIPRQLGNLTNLVTFDISSNALTGEIPSDFINLKQLKLFNLFLNRLHGSIPDYIAELPSLETLCLWKNNFTGRVPQDLGKNGKLRELDLSSNKLTGAIPRNLCASHQLRVLILFKNFLFGTIPEDLGNCSSLVRARLGQNYLNGSVPNGFIYLPQLNIAELQDNYLTGPLRENDNPLSNSSSLQILLLSGNHFSGPIPSSIGLLRQVLKLDLSRNSFSGKIPPGIGNCSLLTYLDMSQNHLSGQIPPEISNLHILNYLNLSRNQLNETIPISIGTMKSLTIADFSVNEFSGKVPESGQFSIFKAASFVGNPRLCGTILKVPCNSSAMTATSREVPSYFKPLFATALLICFLASAVAAIIKARQFKKLNSNSWKMSSFQRLEFSVSHVLECVKDGNVIGRGGAGMVYHGKMPNGQEIAIKKLITLGTRKNNYDNGFRAEIQTLGNIRHRNIVRLLAFCTNRDTNLLVYEYMKNGSLGEALHGKRGGILGWNLRYKIASEAAKGLCYLHHDCLPLIVHRDVKSNNILLDSSFEAHVADFGLAKFLVDGGASQCMSAIAGSYGYIAPEYAYTLRVDEKSDVYSFGVVLLELITGHRPVGSFGEGVDIVQWSKMVTNGHKEQVTKIVDPRITTIPKEEAMHLFFIAMLCVQENSIERPTMREVVQMLSEFPHYSHSPNFRSSSSTVMAQSKNQEKDKSSPRTKKEIFV